LVCKIKLNAVYVLKQDTPLFPEGTEFTHEITRETEKAILIERHEQGGKARQEIWLPKSQTKISEDTIELPDWLCKKYGFDLLLRH